MRLESSVPFQNMGPVWKIFVLVAMGVDIPVDAVNSILRSQEEWKKNCEERSTQENLHKRCDISSAFQLCT